MSQDRPDLGNYGKIAKPQRSCRGAISAGGSDGHAQGYKVGSWPNNPGVTYVVLCTATFPFAQLGFSLNGGLTRYDSMTELADAMTTWITMAYHEFYHVANGNRKTQPPHIATGQWPYVQ
jgi:hypothetical protein